MKTTNYILPLAAFAAGALFAKSQSGEVSGIGALKILKRKPAHPYEIYDSLRSIEQVESLLDGLRNDRILYKVVDNGDEGGLRYDFYIHKFFGDGRIFV